MLLTLGCVALLVQDPPPPASPASPPSPAPQELPRLAAPFRVEADGGAITAVTGHAAPFMVDWDGDGKRDLVVGMFGSDEQVSGGTARFYKNVGTAAAPRFGAFATLQAAGKPASMESG